MWSMVYVQNDLLYVSTLVLHWQKVLYYNMSFVEDVFSSNMFFACALFVVCETLQRLLVLLTLLSLCKYALCQHFGGVRMYSFDWTAVVLVNAQ